MASFPLPSVVAPRKGIHRQKQKQALERRIGAAAKLEGFPPVPLVKKALAKAMHALPQIKQQHHSAKELPAPVQSAANADLAGILWFNGFGGRKKEWEIMLREHCQEQFAKVLDYFVCHVHNTSQTYGSLAKSLAPGTVQAITTHFDLPCRPSVKTLFVPSIEGTELVSIPYLLERFAKPICHQGYSQLDEEMAPHRALQVDQV